MAIVKYNAKNVYTCQGIRLLPGVNLVGDALIKSVLSNRYFKHRVDNGVIEIEMDVSEKKKPGRPKKMTPERLVKLMPEVYDVELLRKYVAENKDDNIVKAAQKQIDRIMEEPSREENGVTIK